MIAFELRTDVHTWPGVFKSLDQTKKKAEKQYPNESWYIYHYDSETDNYTLVWSRENN